MKNMGKGEYFSPQQIAELYGVHINTVYKLIYRGELKALKIGNNIRIRREDVGKYVGDTKII